MPKDTVIDLPKNKKTLDQLLGGYSGPDLEKKLYTNALKKQKKDQNLKLIRSKE